MSVAVVAAEPALEKEAQLSQRAIRDRLAKDARFEVIGLETPRTTELAERAKAGRGLFSKGVDALDAVEYPAAVARLDEAIEAIEAYLQSDLTAQFPALLDAIGMKAVALRLAGKTNTADDELTRLFTLGPAYRFDPGRWPPAVQTWIDRKQQLIAAMTSATVEVAAPTATAEVFVDGTFRGVTPLEVSAGPGSSVSVELELSSEGREVLSRLENLKVGFARGAPESAARSLLGRVGAVESVALALEVKEGEVWASALRLDANGHTALQTKSLGRRGDWVPESAVALALATLELAGASATQPATTAAS